MVTSRLFVLFLKLDPIKMLISNISLTSLKPDMAETSAKKSSTKNCSLCCPTER